MEEKIEISNSVDLKKESDFCVLENRIAKLGTLTGSLVMSVDFTLNSINNETRIDNMADRKKSDWSPSNRIDNLTNQIIDCINNLKIIEKTNIEISKLFIKRE